MKREQPTSMMAAMVGIRIRAARKRMSMTLREMGPLLGVSAQAVDQWELGETSPSARSVEGLVALTGRPVHWFRLPVDVCDCCGQFLPVFEEAECSGKSGEVELDCCKKCNSPVASEEA